MTFKITKFVHSCLLVETPDRVALFDPGVMSTSAVNINSLTRLDDTFITHNHADHFDVDFVKKLVEKFPNVRITTTNEVVQQLAGEGIKASNTPPEGVQFFQSPHENVQPLFPQPEEIGVHYLNSLSHPGDSHSFTETKAILALPVTAPWGATIKALNLALELQPKHVLPIHDWHWSDAARTSTYDMLENQLGKQGIKFYKLETGVPVEIEV
ncbi:MAG TPA: MBL fold metallo-hydrolase [Candidatus Saccharimonadales bacterium]|jgi:L-ascorbate metabolism protein UlaG (beta-lactamase superfamily)|nr:MBL fold metallo-hydrolase [Candidatus Saccharimonadales bacterium]